MEESDQVLHESGVLEAVSVEVIEVNIHCSCLLGNYSLSESLIKIEGLTIFGVLVQVHLDLAEV